MIQRLQSVFLLLAIVCMAALFTLGFPNESRAAEALPWFLPGLLLLTGATIVAAGLALFQYRQRETQMRTVFVALGLAGLVLVLQVVGYALAGDFDRMTGEGAVLGYVALALPVVASVLLLLARRRIAADIALVRSMDRLR
jgi:hypothetical protein